TVTTLHIHHHCDGYATCNPFAGGSRGVAYRRHVSGLTCCNQHRGGVAQRITVVGVVVGRGGTTTFITEEMGNGSKFALIFSLLLPLVEPGLHHFCQQFLRFYQRYLYVTVRVAVERQLTGDSLG